MRAIRDFYVSLAPSFLRRKWGRAWHLGIGTAFAGMAQTIFDAVAVRTLRYAPANSLGEHADTRQIERAAGESIPSFLRRLAGTFEAHALGGTKKGLEQQLRAAGFSGAYTMENADWSPDGDAASWWRFWTIIDQPHSFGTTYPDGTWGDPGLWGDGGTWASVSSALLATIRRVIRTWKGAHTIAQPIHIILSGELWGAPASGTWGDPGTWGGKSLTVPA